MIGCCGGCKREAWLTSRQCWPGEIRHEPCEQSRIVWKSLLLGGTMSCEEMCGNWRQRAGSNLELRVCKSNSHHSRPPNPCFSKRFWKGDWRGSVTAHILDLYGYGYEYTLGSGNILVFICRRMYVRDKEKMTNIPAITTCFTKTPGVREKSFRPNQSESDFLNASDLANIPREERHT